MNLNEKADPELRDALSNRDEDEILCVILQLNAEARLLAPNLPFADFPTWAAWQQEIVHQTTERMYEAVAPTLEQLRGFGLDPWGWELGQVVIHGNRAAILKALACEGVKFGVLDWDLGIYKSLTTDEENLKRIMAESHKRECPG